MILTDREWLRMVTFALVAGGVLGASYAGALTYTGHDPLGATVGGVGATGAIAVLAHVVLRHLLDRAS